MVQHTPPLVSYQIDRYLGVYMVQNMAIRLQTRGYFVLFFKKVYDQEMHRRLIVGHVEHSFIEDMDFVVICEKCPDGTSSQSIS